MDPTSNEEISYFNVKIRENSQRQFELRVSSSMLVSELKSSISSICKIPISQQKLISSGKLLKDDFPLSFYKLNDGHVIQLSTFQPELQDPPSLPSNQSHLSQRISQNERLETIKQGLQTVNTLLETLNPHYDDDLIAFDYKLRHLYPGQWVDIQDTVEQWLEAQIVEISENPQSTQVLIHYNGWPSQWDEWIDSSSSRIQPFHSHTNQSVTSPMSSPYPTLPIDIENSRQSEPCDRNIMFKQGLQVMNKMKIMLEKFYNKNIIYQHEKAGEKVHDLRFRLGIGQKDEEKEEEFEERLIESAALDCEERESIDSVDVDIQERSGVGNEIGLLRIQTAPLLDRTGRLMTDFATLIPDPLVPIMPSPAELSQITSANRSDIGIQVFALVASRNNN
ncbi:hypothetical protein SteCoe_36723 [Stentor coeruleus]|uniref:Ubiquitin-like domain-containing protein n=1 Tax=Stentor coeruleus TaxID=5963 RepID=A0A1R2APM0_9CILI|nr:hypothetical protein SteCoe_36723 [Stentor coeruleus]